MTDAASVPVIPLPAEFERGAGTFQLRNHTRILCDDPALDKAGLPAYLRATLAAATGFGGLPSGKAGPSSCESAWQGALVLSTAGAASRLGPEGYELVVSPDHVLISASAAAGIFYGIQTLRQLLPPAIFGSKPARRKTWGIPAVTIRDWPRFAWRGLMLDVGRYTFTVEQVKRFIDLLAMHKLNTLHLHLTDDQGWRIEIRKHPKLTEIGAWRRESPRQGDRNNGDGVRYGGYFTQAELRDIVAYAGRQFVTVVPEIEMPGHALAALAAHPELSCTGGPFETRTRWSIEENVFCAGNDATFALLEDVLAEVAAIFPGPFVHIGGDECPKGRWQSCPKCQARKAALGLKDERELQSYFIKRIAAFLASRGKRLIGWDEILEGGLAPGAAVMAWRSEEGAVEAARAGHDAVMSPITHCYFDYHQAPDGIGEPEAIGGFLPLQRVYSYNPVSAAIPPHGQRHVLGVQGNLWTEYVPDFGKAEYMTYPRGCALAEVAWTPDERKDYGDFMRRLSTHLRRMDAMKVSYRKPKPADEPPAA